MSGRRKMLIAAAGLATAGIIAALAIRGVSRERVGAVTGVILRQDANVRNQVPIPGASIGFAGGSAKSEANGLFHLNLHPERRVGELLELTISHPEYETQKTVITANGELYVLYLKPLPVKPVNQAPVTVTNPRVRYAVTETSTVNIGSAAQTFEVVNQANVPCNGAKPCSPDGKWKAAIAGKSLDAGDDNLFENARVTCIAGPCPFTRIEKDDFSAGGRTISVLVRNWSDTATFLFEAEVTHTMVSDTIRQAYPAIFGDAMDFTLPATAEGPSIQATVNGEDIVFPVTPNWSLTWATCSVTTSRDGTKLFHCDVKRGYRLQESPGR
ncbi:MAG TPA: hypothetical protein VKX39_10015 [Bryobacteraceae bacterium]|nr:hypothetical protein [Bryobacteraceae bacterium]